MKQKTFIAHSAKDLDLEVNTFKLGVNDKFSQVNMAVGPSGTIFLMQTLWYEDKVTSKPTITPGPRPKCESCGKNCSDKVKEFSMNKYNKILCMECQKAEPKEEAVK